MRAPPTIRRLYRAMMVTIGTVMIASASPTYHRLGTAPIELHVTGSVTKGFVLQANRAAANEAALLRVRMKVLEPCGRGGTVTLTSASARDELRITVLPTTPRDSGQCPPPLDPVGDSGAMEGDADVAWPGLYPGEGDLVLGGCGAGPGCEHRITLHAVTSDPGAVLAVTLVGLAEPPSPSGCDDDHDFSDAARITLVSEEH